MKKSLLALAVLGAFAGVASAQSSVTIFGVVDLSLANIKNDGSNARKSMNSNALNSNRLGFRGVEDLGGGLRAGFHLEGGMANDNPGAQDWRRRSTVSLMGGFGEIRLGRDYTPSFWNTTVFDPFGTNGVGSSLNISRGAASITPPNVVNGAQGVQNYVRANNSVGYFLPALGGLYGQVMVAPGEGTAAGTGNAKYTGGRIGFGAGPFNVAGAVGNTEMNAAGTLEAKIFNIAGSYKFGPATIMAQWNNDKLEDSTTPGDDGKEKRLLLGANVVVGQGEIRASWVKTDFDATGVVGDAGDASQIAIGYIYNLSPRTALYATYASISNKAQSNFSVAGGTAIAALPGPLASGGKSKGYEAGLRHSF